MIQDYLENADSYRPLGARVQKAFDFLQNEELKTMPDGRHAIDGDNVYALIQSYETQLAAEKQFEAHRRYIDLQYVISGRETIVWSTLARLTGWLDYDEVNDAIMCPEGEGTALLLDEGCFVVLFPQDAHKPGCIWSNPAEVKKAVIKILR